MTLAILATVFALYMAVCDYAGISEKIEYLQYAFIWRGRHDLVYYPRWFIHGTVSGMLAVLCIYAIYRMKSAKNRFGTLVLCLLIPYFLNAQFSPGAKGLRAMTICMTLFLGFMFAMANIPEMVSRAITNRVVVQPSDLEEKPECLCRRKLQQVEWICFFPLKKVLIGGLWLVDFVLGILGIVAFCRDSELNFLLIGLLLLATAICTAQKAWRYVKTPYHCVPVLNKVLSKKQIENLLQGEQFAQISFENTDLQKYTPVLLSKNWAIIEGILVSRKLALRGDIDRGWAGRETSRKISRIEMTYLNGARVRTRTTDIYLTEERASEMKTTLCHIAGIHFPLCASEKIVQKYNTILPEIQIPEEKLWYLLTHDTSEIKQDYQDMFPPKNESGKKKRSQKKSDRKQ